MDLLSYELYHTDSPASAGGAAKTVKSTPRPDIRFNMQLVESCWVEIDPCITSVQSEFTCIFIYLFLFFLFLFIYYYFFVVVALKSLCPFLYAAPLFSLSFSL